MCLFFHCCVFNKGILGRRCPQQGHFQSPVTCLDPCTRSSRSLRPFTRRCAQCSRRPSVWCPCDAFDLKLCQTSCCVVPALACACLPPPPCPQLREKQVAANRESLRRQSSRAAKDLDSLKAQRSVADSAVRLSLLLATGFCTCQAQAVGCCCCWCWCWC